MLRTTHPKAQSRNLPSSRELLGALNKTPFCILIGKKFCNSKITNSLFQAVNHTTDKHWSKIIEHICVLTWVCFLLHGDLEAEQQQIHSTYENKKRKKWDRLEGSSHKDGCMQPRSTNCALQLCSCPQWFLHNSRWCTPLFWRGRYPHEF